MAEYPLLPKYPLLQLERLFTPFIESVDTLEMMPKTMAGMATCAGGVVMRAGSSSSLGVRAFSVGWRQPPQERPPPRGPGRCSNLVKNMLTKFFHGRTPGNFVKKTRPFREIPVVRKGRGQDGGGRYGKESETVSCKPYSLDHIVWINLIQYDLMHWISCSRSFAQESCIHACTTPVTAPGLSLRMHTASLGDHVLSVGWSRRLEERPQATHRFKDVLYVVFGL